MKTFKQLRESIKRTYQIDGHEAVTWPEIRGWEIVGADMFDSSGNADTAMYQHLSDGNIVTFSMRELTTHVTAAGKWDFNVAGEEKTGEITSFKDIPKVLKKVHVMASKMITQALKNIPDFKGWTKTVDPTGAIDYDKNVTDDLTLSISIWVDDLFSGGGVATITLTDNGGNRSVLVNEKEVSINGISSIRSIIKQAERMK